MIIHLRKFNIINGIYKTNIKGFKSSSCRQLVNNLQLNNYYTENKTAVSLHGNNLKKLWNPQIYLHLRNYANFSSKPAESKEDLRKTSDKEKSNDSDDDNKQMPDHEHGRTLPRLMNFPEVMWPSVLNTIKNWIMIYFIIRPYMDREFNIPDFIQGAKKAMQVVSSRLMIGDFASLNNLVTSGAVEELTPVVQKLSVSQRRQLEVIESDIYLSFPYQVGILFDETNEKPQKRWVEITMVFHVLRGLRELRETGEEIPWNMGTLPEYQDKMFVCNYRFIKEFTKGIESEWTINVVNHFKPIDLINELKRENSE